MKIYEQEKKDGLEKLLFESGSISFASELKKGDGDVDALKETLKVPEGVVLASENNNPILYPLNTILVTTGINKNDAIFLPEPVWAARHTPEDTPFNYQHDEKDIIGHITKNRVVDVDYKEIADDTENKDLPNKFHILTTAVLYRYWRDEALLERMNDIIKEIEKGEWFVSMEALFDDFDYGIVNEKNELKVIQRNEESAFLTKYLKVCGGTGVYDNCRLGRVLKNIVFAGKGLVRKPANPESVILNSENLTTANENFTVAELMEKTMSVELENKVKDLEKANVDFLSKTAKLETEVASLKTENSQLVTSKTELAKERDELKVKVEELTKANKEAEDKAKGFETKASELQAKVDKIEADAKVAKRVGLLTAKGKTQEEAKELFDKLVALSDEHFDIVVAQIEKKDEKGEKKELTEKEKAALAKEGLNKTDTPNDTVPNQNQNSEVNKVEDFKALKSAVASLMGVEEEKK